MVLRHRKKFGLFLVLTLVLVGSGFLVFHGHRIIPYFNKEHLLLVKKQAEWTNLRERLEKDVLAFKGTSGVVIKDLNSGWEMTHQPDKRFPAASVVKIPIMVACFQAIQEGKIQLDTQLQLTRAARVGGSGTLKNMALGSSFSLEDLMERMMNQSDNSATNILIDALGIDYLNAYFKRIGLRHTNLSRKMMDFTLRRRGIENYTTANDIALVLEKLYQKELLSVEFAQRSLELMKKQKFNDRIPALLPKNIPVAHKTGLERFICHDAGIVFTEKGDYLICVLTKQHVKGPSYPAKAFIAKISLHAYRYMTAL